MQKPKLTKDKVTPVYESRFLNVYGMEYVEGKQYMNASRRGMEKLVALKSETEFKSMLPDAVSVITVIDGAVPKLLLTYEFRYPAGQYLLSVPAGLIDPEDEKEEAPLLTTAIRELKEETNISVTNKDRIFEVNHLLFSTPGMTDESNGIVCAVISEETQLSLSQEGALGTECFDGFELLTKEDAKRLIERGTDKNGVFYSVYTWMALVYFISDMWK